MAELPDLAVFAAILNRRFKGKTLEQLDVSISRKLNVSAKELKEALEDQELTEVKREGKTLQFHFSGGQVLGMHLMLRGELVSLDGKNAPKFQIMAFHFKGGNGFALVDLQKMATPTLQPPALKAPDALSLEKEFFTDLLSKKRTVIKTLLMDQKLMRGIGNSYADEILYHAGISPFSIANLIPARAVNKLYSSITTVLEKAIRDIGEENGDELKGELRHFLKVHNPRLKTTQKGEAIENDKIGGRSTYYTKGQVIYN